MTTLECPICGDMPNVPGRPVCEDSFCRAVRVKLATEIAGAMAAVQATGGLDAVTDHHGISKLALEIADVLLLESKEAL